MARRRYGKRNFRKRKRRTFRKKRSSIKKQIMKSQETKFVSQGIAYFKIDDGASGLGDFNNIITDGGGCPLQGQTFFTRIGGVVTPVSLTIRGSLNLNNSLETPNVLQSGTVGVRVLVIQILQTNLLITTISDVLQGINAAGATTTDFWSPVRHQGHYGSKAFRVLKDKIFYLKDRQINVPNNTLHVSPVITDCVHFNWRFRKLTKIYWNDEVLGVPTTKGSIAILAIPTNQVNPSDAAGIFWKYTANLFYKDA